MQPNDRALADGDAVVLVDRRGRRHLKRLRAGHRMTIRSSVFACDRLIGLAEGARIADRDEEFRVFRPGYGELVPLLERSAEPVFAKDAGLIVTRGDIRPGHTVIEIGAGCGALSMALLRAVGPTGQLVTYEIREDFADEARRNVERFEGGAGAARSWTIRIRDAATGLDETDVDRVVIDIPNPVSVLGAASAALRDGGFLVTFCPTVLQVRDVHDAIARSGALAFAETYEVLERRWHVEHSSVRPDHRMVAHTGFITVARRVAR